jgi:NAD+ kinase
MSNEHFKSIGIIGRAGSKQVVDVVCELKKFLATLPVKVFLEDETAKLISKHDLQVCSRKLLGEVCDLVIVVGGDGCLLGAARSLASYGVPLLGINRGRLGFLTDISPDEVKQKVGEVLKGEYTVEQRFLLDAYVKRKNEPIATGSALNDIVLHPGQSTRMIEFELYIDGQFVYSQRSDGLIVATPTGSTAYALSGGGPIMHPKLDALVLVPMFPHTLSSRPIVIDGQSEIKIVIGEDNELQPQIICDGQMHMSAAPGDSISIHKKPHALKLVHPMGHDYYHVCRTKLGWGTKLGE